MRGQGESSLGPFLAEVEARVMALDDDELRAVDLHLAGQVDSTGRRGFLAQLDAVGTTGPQGGVESDDLMSRIGGFAVDVEAGRWADWDEGWGGYESRWDDDSGDWADELAWLLDSIAARFTARDYAAAAVGYGRLLGVVAAGEEEGNLPPLHVAGRDMDWSEISARWLRSIYEANSDLADRVAQMTGAVAKIGSIVGPPTLQAVLDAHRPAPKDVAEFLPAWITELASRLLWSDSPSESTWESRPLWDLLVEATTRQEGPVGVLSLARRSGTPSARRLPSGRRSLPGSGRHGRRGSRWA